MRFTSGTQLGPYQIQNALGAGLTLARSGGRVVGNVRREDLNRHAA
jgi:hypothetical protein